MIIRNVIVLFLSVGLSLASYGRQPHVPPLQPKNASSSTAALIAHVDKRTIGVGDSFSLTIEYSGQSATPPDFSPLERDFDILSRQVSRAQSYNNGAFSAKTSWILVLAPKDSKKKSLVVPSLSLNNEKTAPITIEQDDNGGGGNASTQEIDLTVVADKTSAYVNSEIIITATIKTHLVLQNGSLTNLELADTIVESLGDDQIVQVVENGILYHVVKRKYAIYPSNPGTLTIPAFVFRAVEAGGRNSRLGFGFMPSRKETRQQSKEFSIAIKDVPSSFPKDQPFLALKSFAVIESFDEASPEFEVNKAISRRFEMKAKGTLPAFLPTINVPQVKNLQVYADAGQKQKTVEEDGLMASLNFSHVYMPTAPGAMVVPEQTIYWWDTENDVLKTTVIRALEIGVKGDGSASEPPPVETPEPETKPEEPSVPSKLALRNPWIYGGVPMVIVLVLIGIMLLVARRRRRALPKVFDTREQELRSRAQTLMLACDSKDPKQVYERLQSLRSWLLKQEHGYLFDDAFLSSMHSLEQTLFTPNKIENVEGLLGTIKRQAKGLSFGDERKGKFTPLYPS